MTAPVPVGPRPAPGSCTELFLAFTLLALRGFGGVLPWAQRVLVEERRWVTREEFVELLAFGQLLPGPNIINVAIMVGDRFFGWRGSVAALAGMLCAPMVLVLALAVLYGEYAKDPLVRSALVGMSAVAAGLIMATSIKLVLGQLGRWPWLVFGVAAFVMVALLRVPLVWTLVMLAPIAVVAAWWVEKPGNPTNSPP